MKPGYWIPITMVGLFFGALSMGSSLKEPQAAEAEKLPEKRIFVFQNGESERQSDEEARVYIMFDAQTGKQYVGVPNVGIHEITPEKKDAETKRN